jgi:FkbM family methyltransferase
MQRKQRRGAMPDFDIRGITLEVPASSLTPRLREALHSGRYEQSEARAVSLHLRPEDRVLELGAGAGYLSVQIGRIVAPGALLSVEASPEMAPVVARNLARNGVAAAEVLHGAVVPDGFAGESVRFFARRAFWASSLSEGMAGDVTETEVPALRLGALMARHRPSVVMVDIEGGEAGLFDAPWPAQVRLVVIELHPMRYAKSVVRQIFDGMSASGLAYCPSGSRGDVVVFERVGDD